MKTDFILQIEKKDGILSKMICPNRTETFVKSLLNKKYKVVYSVSGYEKGKKPDFSEIILETAQPFYIHLSKGNKEWSMDIYYLPDKHKELLFFINQIEKISENATTNDDRIETKN